MSGEFTHEVAMKFLPAQVSLNYAVNVFEAILYIKRFFNLTKYRDIIVKHSLLITHAGMQI